MASGAPITHLHFSFLYLQPTMSCVPHLSEWVRNNNAFRPARESHHYVALTQCHRGILRHVRLNPTGSNELALPSKSSHIFRKDLFFFSSLLRLAFRLCFRFFWSIKNLDSTSYCPHYRHPVVVSIVLPFLNRPIVIVFRHVTPSSFIDPYRTFLFHAHNILDLLSTNITVISTVHILAESTAHPLIHVLPSTLLSITTPPEYHIDGYEAHDVLLRSSTRPGGFVLGLRIRPTREARAPTCT